MCYFCLKISVFSVSLRKEISLSSSTNYYKDIYALLQGLRTVTPISAEFHIHQFKDTPETWIKETSIFRSDTYALILLTKGKASYKIGLYDYEINDGSLYFMGPQHLRYYNRLSDWEGYVVIFMESFFENHPSLKKLVTDFEGFKIHSKVVVSLEKDEIEETEKILQLLYDTSRSTSLYRFSKAKSLLELLILQSEEVYKKYHAPSEPSKHHRIVKEFNTIVEQHLYDITQNKVEKIVSIQEIAQQMHLNSTYLGEVLKKVTGRTPKEILSERIVLEAKSLLHNTDLSVNEIAYFLKFQDASNFTKFFKSKTEITPKKYRENSSN
jgi:AraC-like DNA-binding protein